MSYKKSNNNNQYRNQYSNQYMPEYNNSNNFNYINNNSSSNNYVTKPYEMGEHAAINPRIQELSESEYVQSNQHQPYHSSPKRGSASNSSSSTAIGTPQLRSVNDDDNVSVGSASVYSQPSTLSRNNSKNHATNELPKNGVYDNSRFLGNNTMIYPSSHQAISLVFNNQQQQPLIDRTSNLNDQNNYDSYNSGNGNNNQQQDVYNDYNNYHYPPQNQSYYNDEEATRHNSMTLSDNNNMSSSYDFHNGNKFDTEKEDLNQPMMIDDTLKKRRNRRCCCCSGIHCVIITFVILILLAVALYFVWPRIPTVKILDAKPIGTPSISQDPPLVNLNFVMQTQIDNKENWVPFRFNRIEVQVFDSNTIASFNKPIATGNITDYTLPPKQVSVVGFPLTVNYVAENANDPVLQDFLSACTKQLGTQQTTLNLRVDVKLFVWGIDWVFAPAVSVPVNGLKCPYPQ